MLSGFLRKMKIETQNPLLYYLSIANGQTLPLNDKIGKKCTMTFSKLIQCVHCAQAIKKSFNQGYCYNCFRKLAACDLCIMKPELCHYHKGTCREPSWGEKHCMQNHIVYLSQTSSLKVGITREENIPIRWYDQGAVCAMPLYRVTSRYQSGILEVAMAKVIGDKTNWRKMLASVSILDDFKRKAVEYREAADIKNFISNNALWQEQPPEDLLDQSEPIPIYYPVHRYLEKVKSINIDKTPCFSGVLLGIKGQYLILDCGVINIRKYTGYEMSIEFEK